MFELLIVIALVPGLFLFYTAPGPLEHEMAEALYRLIRESDEGGA